jgi:uncharacterized protein
MVVTKDAKTTSWNLAAMEWFNPPASHAVANGVLSMVSGEKGDLWQETYYGYRHDDAHALLAEAQGEFVAELTFSGLYETLYDQAGLLVRADARKWMKCGVEFTDGRTMFSVVVTNGVSDWSTLALDVDQAAAVSVRVTRMGDALFVQYSVAAGQWHMARLCAFPGAPDALKVGPYCCSPLRAGFAATFSGFRLGPVESREIH